MTTVEIEHIPTSTPANLNNLIEPLISKLANFENVMEPPKLSHLSCRSYVTHHNIINGLTKNKASINPYQIQLHRCKMDPNSITFDDVVAFKHQRSVVAIA